MPQGPFLPLRSRNYRLFFTGQSISLLGTWMQKTAVSWVVYTETQSATMLGLTVFATLFPTALLSLFGGVVSDRFNRHRVMVITQVASLVQASLLAISVYLLDNPVWPIIILSAVLGIINSFDVPTRQAMVHELVDDKAHLPNAVALNATMVNLAKLVGPALAGIALQTLGATACFGLNALSFIAVIGSLLAMRLPAFVPKAHTQSVFTQLRDGLSYVQATPHIRFIILALGLVSFFLLPFTTLLAVYAKDVFSGQATTFGALEAAIGLGATIGAVYLASLKTGADLNAILTRNTFFFGLGLLLFAFTPWLIPSLFCLALAAFGMMAQITIGNMILQTTVEARFRGRVLSLYVLVYALMVPLGSLTIGAVSQRVGVQRTVFMEGLIALIITWLQWQEHRRIRLRASTLAIPNPPQMLTPPI